MAVKSPVSGASLANNLYAKALNSPNWQEAVIDRSMGYNKILNLMMKMNAGQSQPVYEYKKFVASVGSTSISNTVFGASTLSGSNLVVTLANAEDRIRVGDLVRDSNLIAGLVLSRTNTTLTLEPHSVSAWNTSTHFTAGMNVADMGNVSAKGKTTGISTLSVTPDTDYALLRKTRDTEEIGLLDKISTFVKWNGKFWYNSQQEFFLDRFARIMEYEVVFDERIENTTSAIGPYNTTGGIRWTCQKNGGTYMPLSNNITQNDLDDFIYTMIMKFADPKKQIKLYCGRKAMESIQKFLSVNVVTAGVNNTMGGSTVQGYNIYEYGIAGMTVTIEHYPMFDDILFSNQISSITGAPLMSSTIMAVDITSADSVNGSGKVPAIQQFYHAGLGGEISYKFQPGMLGNEYSDKEYAMGGADFVLSQSDIDVSTWNIERVHGVYCIPEKFGWMQLTR